MKERCLRQGWGRCLWLTSLLLTRIYYKEKAERKLYRHYGQQEATKREIWPRVRQESGLFLWILLQKLPLIRPFVCDIGGEKSVRHSFLADFVKK